MIEEVLQHAVSTLIKIIIYFNYGKWVIEKKFYILTMQLLKYISTY